MTVKEDEGVGSGETTLGKRRGNAEETVQEGDADDLRVNCLFGPTRPDVARGKGRDYLWFPGRPDVALRVVSDVAVATHTTLALVFAPKKEGRWQPES